MTDADFDRMTAGMPDTLGDTTPTASPEGEVIPPTRPVEASAPPAFSISTEMLQGVIELPFQLLSMREGRAFWELKKPESKALAESWLPVVEKLLAIWGAQETGAIWLAAMLTLASVTPRIFQEKQAQVSTPNQGVTVTER